MQIISNGDNCMKFQILFSEKSKKNASSLSSGKLAQRVLKINPLP